MKKLLTILGAITLSTTASTSAIACGAKEQPQDTTDEPEVAEIRLNEQVAQDLGLIDENGKSLVEVGINGMLAPDSVKWDFKGKIQHNPFSSDIKKIKATKLLNADNTAVSKESENFLINTLQLTKNATDNTFRRDNARNITILTSEIKPTLSKTKYRYGYETYETYKVTGGTFKLQFVKGTEKLGDNYTIDLKGNENGLNIKSLLEIFWIENDNFSQIKDFEVGEDNSKPINGTPVYEYLKTDSDVYKKLEWLNELLIDTGDKVSIIVVNRDLIEDSDVWEDDTNNYLTCKIKFGTITSDNLIQLYPYLS